MLRPITKGSIDITQQLDMKQTIYFKIVIKTQVSKSVPKTNFLQENQKKKCSKLK